MRKGCQCSLVQPALHLFCNSGTTPTILPAKGMQNLPSEAQQSTCRTHICIPPANPAHGQIATKQPRLQQQQHMPQ